MKYLFCILCAFVLTVSIPQYSFAAASNTGGTSASNSGGTSASNGGGIQNPLGQNNKDLASFLESLLRIVFLLGTMIAVFFIVYAGFKYVMAQGDPAKLKSAHSMLLWACVGTAILLGAQVIADVIANTVKQLGA
ncbi:MAG: hypothetical protein V4664_00555 [Patescibacteria group bacterium]